jgi:hypothetical protein
VLSGGLLDILGMIVYFQTKAAKVARGVQVSFYTTPALTSYCVSRVGLMARIPKYDLSYMENTQRGDLEVKVCIG